MKRIVPILCLLTSVAAPARADLKYSIHMATAKADMPAGQGNNPMFAMIGDMMMKQLLPSGAADMIYIIGERGTRIEYTQAAMGQPEGSVNLVQPDGTIVVLNPKDQTYWKVTPQNPASSMMKGTATTTPTGRFETVAGLKCEVIAFDWKMDLPAPRGARPGTGAGLPPSLVMAGDTCVLKDQFQHYAELSTKSKATSMLSALGLDQLMQGGIVLRQTMRIAGIELKALVTKIGEEDVPASAFEIPSGYKEGPPPSGMR